MAALEGGVAAVATSRQAAQLLAIHNLGEAGDNIVSHLSSTGALTISSKWPSNVWGLMYALPTAIGLLRASPHWIDERQAHT